MHPVFDVSEAVRDIGMSASGNGFGRHLELDVVSVTVEAETLISNDIAKGKHVEKEKERTKHGTLEQRRGVGDGVVDMDKLSVFEVCFKSGEGSASDAEEGFEEGVRCSF